LREGIFRELYNKATIDNLTEEEMKTYQKSVLEYDDVILSMDYVKSRNLEIGEKRGIEIGERRGIEIGKRQGVEIGERRGIEKGREKELIKFVRNCYKRNMSIDEIAKLTDLKEEQISAMTETLKRNE
jgi:flagellar biosynthesis/type III secretory pathway protein FliH